MPRFSNEDRDPPHRAARTPRKVSESLKGGHCAIRASTRVLPVNMCAICALDSSPARTRVDARQAPSGRMLRGAPGDRILARRPFADLIGLIVPGEEIAAAAAAAAEAAQPPSDSRSCVAASLLAAHPDDRAKPPLQRVRNNQEIPAIRLPARRSPLVAEHGGPYEPPISRSTICPGGRERSRRPGPRSLVRSVRAAPWASLRARAGQATARAVRHPHADVRGRGRHRRLASQGGAGRSARRAGAILGRRLAADDEYARLAATAQTSRGAA